MWPYTLRPSCGFINGIPCTPSAAAAASNEPRPQASGSGDRESVRIRTRPLTSVELGQPAHPLGTKLEVEDVEILFDPRRGDRFRNHRVAQLDVPAQHDLRRG